ncbi:hypothetical protein ACFOG5_01125 [Pedobacter fastidiosus]
MKKLTCRWINGFNNPTVIYGNQAVYCIFNDCFQQYGIFHKLLINS